MVVQKLYKLGLSKVFTRCMRQKVLRLTLMGEEVC